MRLLAAFALFASLSAAGGHARAQDVGLQSPAHVDRRACYRMVQEAGRWVGGAMAACPEDVPWQRVINAQGKISLRGGSEVKQRELLEAEGVVFDSRERVDLKRFGWTGPQGLAQPALWKE